MCLIEDDQSPFLFGSLDSKSAKLFVLEQIHNRSSNNVIVNIINLLLMIISTDGTLHVHVHVHMYKNV